MAIPRPSINIYTSLNTFGRSSLTSLTTYFSRFCSVCSFRQPCSSERREKIPILVQRVWSGPVWAAYHNSIALKEWNLLFCWLFVSKPIYGGTHYLCTWIQRSWGYVLSYHPTLIPALFPDLISLFLLKPSLLSSLYDQSSFFNTEPSFRYFPLAILIQNLD